MTLTRPRKLFIGGGGQGRGGKRRGGEKASLLNFEGTRIYGGGFQGCEDSIKVKRREIKISYRKFYERDIRDGLVKKKGILSVHISCFSSFLSSFY